MLIHEFAPAKLNLYLHITGRRADGYHDLDSLVAFAGVGDEIRLEPADAFRFLLEGPQAHKLKDEPTANNLVVKAVQSLAKIMGKPLHFRLTLVKNLPVASGIGGGSSDAAAALRAVARHWGLSLNDPRLTDAACEHGQDVPVCLHPADKFMTADGIAAAPTIPHAEILLGNPIKALPPPAGYQGFRESQAPFSPLARFTETPQDLAALVALLKARHNDLTDSAAWLMPDIRAILTALDTTEGCLLPRMSGSGATCFGIFENRDKARHAAASLLAAHPDWWIVPTYLPVKPERREVRF